MRHEVVAVKLVLVRHGETALNAARVLQPADTPLNGRGQAQALAVAARLQGFGLAGLISSDLPRAVQTAQAVAQACGLALGSSPLLQERNFGALRGLAYDSLGHDPLRAEAAPPGGESLLQFRQRVAAAYAQICALQAQLGGALAVVTHGLVIRELLLQHLGLDAAAASELHLGNTSVTVATARAPHAIELLNCTDHLRGAAGDDAQALSGG